MNRILCILVLTRAEVLRHTDIDAASKTDQKAREQRHERCGRADRAERRRICKLSNDCHVRHIEHDLQKLREDQRYTEQEYIFPERAVGHADPAAAARQLFRHYNRSFFSLFDSPRSRPSQASRRYYTPFFHARQAIFRNTERTAFFTSRSGCTLTVRRPLQTSSCPSVCFGAYGGATVLRSHSVGVRNLSDYFFSASMTACGMETSRSAKVIFAPSEAFASATTM